ncbi:MAG: FAD/NAD(P)-binding oxidoreductase, partial [Rikenellaceae bacterium]
MNKKEVASMNDYEIENGRKGKSKISRKDFLLAMGVVGVAVGGYASYKHFGKSSAKGKILIIGGGAAGISIANRLLNLLADPDITIVDPSDTHFYQPGFTLIGGGVYSPSQVVKSQRDCMPTDVKWVKESVVEVNPDNNYAITSGGKKLEYDYMVLVPGIQLNYDQIEGFSREQIGKNGIYSIYDFGGAAATWQGILDMEKLGGGRMIFSDTHTKLKCGGAPKKINMMAERYLTKKGIRDKYSIELLSTMKNMFDLPIIRTRLAEIYEQRNIPVKFEQRLKWIDIAGKKAGFEQHASEGKEIITESYDFLHIVPPMSAPDFIPNCGLASEGVEGGWASVDKHTMVHTKYANIISLGDASNLPTSKTSAAIRIQLPIAAANLVSLMEGKEPKEKYNGYTACPIVTDYGKVLMAEFDYDKKMQPTIPFIDLGKEHDIWWMLKVYGLKNIYFHGMLNG